MLRRHAEGWPSNEPREFTHVAGVKKQMGIGLLRATAQEYYA